MTQPLTFRGVGIHSGEICTISITPDTTLPHTVFKQSGELISAVGANLVRSNHRATQLQAQQYTVGTVEHLLFALSMFSIRAIIEVDGPEIPILDGSALPFVSALWNTGYSPFVNTFAVPSPARITNGSSIATVTPCGASDTPTYQVELDFPHTCFHQMKCDTKPTETSTLLSIASARTFAFEHEVENLRKHHLAQGGSLQNALVLTPTGVVNPEGMRLPNEPACHKMLDLLGDLSLLGGLPHAHIQIRHPGHQLNHLLISHFESMIHSPKT